MTKKIIGVLGGMGPESTAIFYQEIIKQCQKQKGAQLDEDFPEIFIYNLPIPDVVEGLKNPELILPVLIEGAKKLEKTGIDFMTMPCNTAHYFFDDMKQQMQVPFLSIIEETAKKVKDKGYTKIGLLATETTIDNNIYKKDFDNFGIKIIVPKNQQIVTDIILNILAGKKLDEDKQKLKEIISSMRQEGANAVILGCTDIPILLKQKDTDTELFDTVEILAESTVKFAYQP